MKTFLYGASHSQVSELLKLQIQSFHFLYSYKHYSSGACPLLKRIHQASLINSSQFSTCETTPWVLWLVFRLSSTRETMTQWSKPRRVAPRCSESCTRRTRKGCKMGLFSLKKECLGECVGGIYCCFQLCNGRIARLWKQTFPSKAHCEMVMQQWTQQQALQIPGSYEEKAFHRGDRSVIGIGPLHPRRYMYISPQQCPEQSDLIWHWIWYWSWPCLGQRAQRCPQVPSSIKYSIILHHWPEQLPYKKWNHSNQENWA